MACRLYLMMWHNDNRRSLKMKKIIILLFLIMMCGVAAASKPIARPGVSFGVFYSSLSPYGDWIECNLGYVWRPTHMSHGWRPYLNGRWVWSDYGWYWVSNEPFGWAAFHYGRWYYDDYYGWVWIPDETWGPAWVEWRYNDDYVGWAPLAPYAMFSVGDGITYSHPWSAPAHYWNFVAYHNFSSERINEAVQPVERNTRIFGDTRAMLNIAYSDNRITNRGIEAGTIEQRGNIRIRTADITERSSGEGELVTRDNTRDRIEVYRPKLEARLHEEVTRPQNVERANKSIATDFDRTLRQKRQERMRTIEGDTHTFFGQKREQANAPDNRKSTDQSATGRRNQPRRMQVNPRTNGTPPGTVGRPGMGSVPRNPQYRHPRPGNPHPPIIKNKPSPRTVPNQPGKEHGGQKQREPHLR